MRAGFNSFMGLNLLIGMDLPNNKFRGLSPRVNYTDRATASCRRSLYQRLRIEGATLSA
jgi:hypothetical protein